MTTEVTVPVVAARGPRLPLSEAGRLAAHMVARWRAGERPTAAEYAAHHPRLRTDPDAALELIAEELALRDEYGTPADPEALVAAFPAWAAQVRALLRCQAALGPPAGPRFPEAGQALGEFRLVAELGRGAVGRVFAALQPALADRPVVVKLAPAGGDEHLSLARLQHTHVVPLYSAHSFPGHGLDGLCLPYFGGATLAEVLKAAGRRRGGADLLAALRGPTPVPAPRPGPAWAAIEKSGYVNAACWVTACLADALQYAHDRGLLHLDVKPSNVLLAGDGTPMLLDFHLARPPLAAGSMPPEQAAAVEAVRWQQRVPLAVDARADVYALGCVLGEALNGVRVPPAVAALVARCTAADPAARYPTAGAVAADLRRHLADLPLHGVRNRSLTERWAKWRRRRPLALPAAAVVAAALALAAGLAAGRFDRAASGAAGPEQPAADRARAAAARRAACDRARPLYGAEVVPAAEAAGLRAALHDLWANRAGDSPDDRLDLALLLADAECWAAPGDPAAARRAVAVLDEATRSDGPRPALDLARAAHLRRLGEPTGEAVRRAAATPCQTAWDHLAVGRTLLADGDAAAASPHLDRAAELDPGSVWANYYAGVCRRRSGDPAGALAAFAACVALAPDRAWCVHNRGLAYLELGSVEAAVADFDRALALDPGLGAAMMGRAAAHARAGRAAEAVADLDRAAGAGVPAAEAAYHRAAVWAAAGDTAAARAALDSCLTHDPEHRQALALYDRLTNRP